MNVTHAPQPDWEDTEEAGVVQPSDVEGMEHLVDLSETGLAGEAVSALHAVWRDDDGRMYLLDSGDDAHIALYAGISLNSALPDEELSAQREGVLEAEGLGLVPGPVWLGADGALTQTPPETGFDLYLGAATADDRVVLSPSEPIELEE
jgi:hypothetical protein